MADVSVIVPAYNSARELRDRSCRPSARGRSRPRRALRLLRSPPAGARSGVSVSELAAPLHSQVGHPDASTFWGGCGAIRRSVFIGVGGFDAERFPRPSIEDIELGHRLRVAGYRIRLDRSLQGTHLKRWRLLSVIRTDIACRAVPWARLILINRRVPDDLNLKMDQRVSAGLVSLAALLCIVASRRRTERQLMRRLLEYV